MAMKKSHISVLVPLPRRKLLEHLKAIDNIPSSQRIEKELERVGAWDRWEKALIKERARMADRD